MNSPKTLNLKLFFLRIVILLLGLTIAHLGVTLFLLANLGSDPFNVLIQGLHHKLISFPIITHGMVHISICFLIVIILLIIDRKYIKIGTILCMLFGGPIIDLFTLLLRPLFDGDILIWQRVISNIIGCIILGFGMTIVIKSDAGTGPNDLVAVVISEKMKAPFGITRVLVDVLFALSGYLLGGKVGIGTVICAFVVGPVAGIFLPINERWINKLYKKIS